jgi:hypothetical protein
MESMGLLGSVTAFVSPSVLSHLSAACFRDIDKDGNEAPDDSFESVLHDGQGGNINFEAGERVKICVSLENSKLIYPRFEHLLLSHLWKDGA